jgi:DNA-binding MarR family transcriptional regulator
MSSKETQNVLSHWRDEVPEDRLAHLIKDATRSLVRALQFRLTEHNVSFGHWAFLRILWAQDGLTQRELSERAGVMEPTTFAAMKAMETLGYIERRHLPGNKKNLHVYLTRSGKALKKVLVPLAEEVNAIGTQGLTEAEVRTARKVLLAIIGNLAEEEAAMEEAERRLPSTRELSRRINGGDA